jgi:hypothetical protein
MADSSIIICVGMGLADAMAFGRIAARNVLEEPALVEPVVDGAAMA